MALEIETFSNVTGGNAAYKAFPELEKLCLGQKCA